MTSYTALTVANSPTLISLLSLTRDGEWGSERPADGLTRIRVIRGADFEATRFGGTSELPVRFVRSDIVARKQLQVGDTVIETAGGSRDRSTGRTLLIAERVLSDADAPVLCASFARFLRPDTALVEPAYLFWFLQDMYAQGRMDEHQVQHTGIARFQFTRFAETTPVPLPPRPQQVKICEVLGALDAKFDLNRRIVQTVQELMKAMFERSVIDGDTRQLTTDVDVRSGGTPKTGVNTYWGGDIPWISIKDLEDCPFVIRTEKSITALGSESSAARQLPDRTVVISARGTVGRIGITIGSMAINQSCYGLVSDTPFLTYQLARAAVGELRARAHGSVFDTITRETLAGLAVTYPKNPARFEESVAPLGDLALACQTECLTLAELRDALLPELISGRMTVN
jgi:type I restriction enzyme S subunit